MRIGQGSWLTTLAVPLLAVDRHGEVGTCGTFALMGDLLGRRIALLVPKLLEPP
jgi:hypothetical protein